MNPNLDAKSSDSGWQPSPRYPDPRVVALDDAFFFFRRNFIEAARIGFVVPHQFPIALHAFFDDLRMHVAEVAVEAFPVKAPTKVVEVTLVKPAIVAAELPKLIAVEPIVTLELTRAELGIDVNPAPEPLN